MTPGNRARSTVPQRIALVASLLGAPVLALTIACEVQPFVVVLVVVLAACVLAAALLLDASRGLRPDEFRGAAGASAASATVVAVVAAFWPLESQGFTAGASWFLTVSFTWAIAAVAAGLLATPRKYVARRSFIWLACASSVVVFEVAWSATHRSVARIVSAAPRGSLRGDTSSHVSIDVGTPGHWVSIEPPPAVHSSSWDVHGPPYSMHPRTLSVRSTAKTGRYVVDVEPFGKPDDVLDHQPGERFVVDEAHGKVPFAFAWIGANARVPTALLGFAIASTLLATMLVALSRRRDASRPALPYRETPEPLQTPDAGATTAIAWLGVGPIAAWRVVAFSFS